ncbi:RNA polymerase sigma factor [Variovorax boronicumulans]
MRPSVWRLIDDRVALPALRPAPRPVAAPTPGVQLQQHLVAQYAPLQRRLERQLGCADLASECLHEAWLRLGECTLQEVPANPDAYVYRVASNLAMDRIRARKRWQGVSAEGADLEAMADPRPGPAQIAQARSDVAAVDRAMARLPQRHRSVLLALRWHEMSRQEVARRQGTTARRVDTTLRQALAELRRDGAAT